jgi:hypothetical protein
MTVLLPGPTRGLAWKNMLSVGCEEVVVGERQNAWPAEESEVNNGR